MRRLSALLSAWGCGVEPGAAAVLSARARQLASHPDAAWGGAVAAEVRRT